jgi:hypothetical protein
LKNKTNKSITYLITAIPGTISFATRKTSQFSGIRFDELQDYSEDGYHLYAPRNIKNGDRVTMTLDLSSRVGHSGTLSMSVNCQPAISLNADMLARLPSGDFQGFVPAVRYFAASITIVSIKEF